MPMTLTMHTALYTCRQISSETVKFVSWEGNNIQQNEAELNVIFSDCMTNLDKDIRCYLFC